MPAIRSHSQCSLMNRLVMLDSQLEPTSSPPSIHPDLYNYDPWKLDQSIDHSFNTLYFPSTAVFSDTTVSTHHLSGEISKHVSPLGLDASRLISSPELRPTSSSVDEIQLNWQKTNNSVAKRTLDNSRQLFDENDFQNLFEAEMHSDLDLDLISNQSALNYLDFSPDPGTLKSFEELFGSTLNQGVSLKNSAAAEDEDLIRSCSSCGILKHHSELSHLRPCLHPHCNTCINTLVNSSCNDPPPPQMVCFLCSQPVIGFDLPIAFELFQDKYHPYNNLTLGIKVPPASIAESFQTSLNRFDSFDIQSPSSDPFDVHLGSLSSGRRSPVLIDEAIPTSMGDSPLSPTTRNSCPWPIVRVDNISWSLTVSDILKWLPDGTKCLPPPELCPLPIHILCNPTDGKTLNYCFIEMRNLSTAHFLVRHRHATKIGNRPCSVVLTSPTELYSNILGSNNKIDEISHDVMKIIQLLLKLCAPQNTSSIKAPERAFFHLMSILSHCEHFSDFTFLNQNESVLDWTNILHFAIETLLACKYDIAQSIKILRVMVDVGISSPLIDKVAMFQFLSQVEIFFNQISRMREMNIS